MHFFDIHTHQARLKPQILSRFPYEPLGMSTYYSVGIHPWYLDEVDIESQINWIKDCISRPNVIAIGECGIDTKAKSSLAYQQEVFERQVEISEGSQLPMILHVVRSHELLLRLRFKLKPTQPWVIHGFRGKISLAQKLVDAGFFISFGHSLIINDPSSQLSFVNLPLSSCFLESDESSYSIEEIYLQAAALRKIPLEQLTAQINKNILQCFNIEYDGTK